MEKATLHLKGQIAELLEDKGKLHAKIVCDTDNLLIDINNVNDLELNGNISIEVELTVKSIQLE